MASRAADADIENDNLLKVVHMMSMSDQADDRAASNQRADAEAQLRQQQFDAQQAQQARANAEQDASLWNQQDANTRLAYANAAIPQINPDRRDAAEQIGNWKSYLAGVGDKTSPYQVSDLFRSKEAEVNAREAQRQQLAQVGMNDFVYKKGDWAQDSSGSWHQPDVIDQDATAREAAIRKQGLSNTIAEMTPEGRQIYDNIKAASGGNLSDPYILGVVAKHANGESTVRWATDNGVTIPPADLESLGTRISHPELSSQADAAKALGIPDVSSVLVFDPRKVQHYLSDKTKGTLRANGTPRSPIEQINEEAEAKAVQARLQQNLKNSKEASEISKLNAETKNIQIGTGDAQFTPPNAGGAASPAAQPQAGGGDRFVKLSNAPAGSKPGDFVNVKLANGQTVLARVQ